MNYLILYWHFKSKQLRYSSVQLKVINVKYWAIEIFYIRNNSVPSLTKSKKKKPGKGEIIK